MSDSDDGGYSKSKMKSKDLKKRIEGFGSSPMPPPVSENPADILWGRVTEDQTFMNWYEGARSSVNAALDAVDDTINAIADAVDDTIAAVIGDEDDEPYPQPEPPRGRRGAAEDATPASGRTPAGEVKKKKKRIDTGERSGTEWKKVVENICVEGDLEDFVMVVRSRVKNEFEESEVGDLIADQLLNEVKATATLRILHVMQTIVADGNLSHAKEKIRSRCATKLGKLQATKCFTKLSEEVLGDYAPIEDGSSAVAQSSANKEERRTGSGSSPSAGSSAPVQGADLLDMAAPSPSTNGSNAARSVANVQAAEQEDLIGLSAPAAARSAPVPALQPPSQSSFRRGAHVRAIWREDGKSYPAVVDSVRGQQVTLQWMRRSATSSPSESFVCDIGDDTTHEIVQLAEVQALMSRGASTSVSSTANDLLDFDAPAASASPSASSTAVGDLSSIDLFAGNPALPSAPPSIGPLAGNNMGALAGLSLDASFSAGAGTSVGAGAGGMQAPWAAEFQAAQPASMCGATVPPSAGRPLMGGGCYASMGGSSLSSSAGPYMAASPASTGYAAAFGGGYMASSGPVLPTAPTKGAPTPKSGAPSVAPGSGSKDLQLGDAFSLTGMR